jgi:hypothetical protein
LTDDHDGFVFDHRTDSPVEVLKSRLGQLLHLPESRLQEVGRNGMVTAREYETARVAALYIDDFEAVLAEQSQR